MTREDIVEKVNALLAEEFEVDAEEFAPMQRKGPRFPWTASAWWTLSPLSNRPTR